MEFELYDRKFKFVDDVLYSFYKRGGRNQIEKWHLIKLTLDNGYKTFAFNVKGKSKHFRFHRVVYYAHNNEWDIYDSSKDNFIDHIDQTRTNNHISNLRVVTNQENCFNTRCKGYYFDKASGKHRARIRLNGKLIHIGYYDTEDEARQAYLQKKAEVHIIIQR